MKCTSPYHRKDKEEFAVLPAAECISNNHTLFPWGVTYCFITLIINWDQVRHKCGMYEVKPGVCLWTTAPSTLLQFSPLLSDRCWLSVYCLHSWDACLLLGALTGYSYRTRVWSKLNFTSKPSLSWDLNRHAKRKLKWDKHTGVVFHPFERPQNEVWECWVVCLFKVKATQNASFLCILVKTK